MAYGGEVTASLQHLLRKTPIHRVRERLGGSHTVVTYPPLDALHALEPGPEPFQLSPPQGPMNYYLHVAFCEWICSFCHYAKTSHTSGRPSPEANDYMAALTDEAHMRADQLSGSDVQSVYIGGGTPTSLGISHLESLLSTVKKLIGVSKSKICIECSPITTCADDGEDKLAALVEGGVTRLSLGIQTFDAAELPKLRGHDQAMAVLAVERVMATGLQVNVDLIQDLPRQTRQMIDEDIGWIARFRPHQVTWYLLRFHAESAMGHGRHDWEEEGIPDSEESALRRDHIIEQLALLGYRREPGCRFSLQDNHDTYKAVRGGVDSHLLGLGASAYSHGWGWFFRNATQPKVRVGLRDYLTRLSTGRTPVGWATRITDSERRAGQLCQASRTRIPGELLRGHDAVAVSARRIVDRLADAGLLSGDDVEGWEPTRLGALFEEEIASLFYSPTMRERLCKAETYWAGDEVFKSAWGNRSASGTPAEPE